MDETDAERETEMKTIKTFEALCEVIFKMEMEGQSPFVRWSTKPTKDAQEEFRSYNYANNHFESGVSVNALIAEEWWYLNAPDQTAAKKNYIAMQVAEYSFLPGKPWLMTATETDRGSDNEPVVTEIKPLAWISLNVIDEAKALYRP